MGISKADNSKRMSTQNVDLNKFNDGCRTQAGQLIEPSSSFLLRKSSSDTSEVNSVGYLELFRKKIGYVGSSGDCTEFEASDESRSIGTGTSQEIFVQDAETQTQRPDGEKRAFEEIEDALKALTQTEDFTTILLTGRQLEDPSSVEDFYELKSIDISDNGIKSLSNLGEMPYLLKINASRNEIQEFLDIEPVPVALKEADLSFNSINVINIDQYWSLTDINLSHNKITHVDGISGLEFLQFLNLSHNKIEIIGNLECPNLLILYLNSNLLNSIPDLLQCNNLRYLDLSDNKLGAIKGLKYMSELTEVHLQGNNIEDISEFDNLKCLFSLTSIRIEPNPLTQLENWKYLMITMLPQILSMDGQRLDPSELRAAKNLFHPSFKKAALIDHQGILLDRACQSATTIFDDYCRNKPLPPIILLVGPPRSHCHTLALLLKQKLRNKVYLGGVHSTATTIEGSNPKVDIPVSYECFKEMKNRGEFLATSKILGRICGFSTSQIACAAEKGSLLIATVPITTAIALKEWNLHPQLILAVPTSPPVFPLEDERHETLKRSLVHGNSGKKRSSKKSTDAGMDHVNFADMLSVVPSLAGATDSVDPNLLMVYHEPMEPVFIDHPLPSILKAPKFEVPDGDDFENNPLFNFDKESNKVVITPHESHADGVLDLEQKTRRLKSLAPGMEKYKSFSADDYDDDEDDDDQLMSLFQFGKDFQEDDGEPDNPGDEGKVQELVEETVTHDLGLEPLEMDQGEYVEMGDAITQTEVPRKSGELEPIEALENARHSSGDTEEPLQLKKIKKGLKFSTDENDADDAHNSFAEPILLDGEVLDEDIPKQKSQSLTDDEKRHVRLSMDPEIAEIPEEEEEEDEEEEEEETGRRRSSQTPKIREPVKMIESEHVVVEEHEEPHCSHKDAMLASILASKEKYIQFHLDNPGFFHVMVDTDDMCESFRVIEELANEALANFKNENVRPVEKSHAGMNKAEEKKFLDERTKHFKACSTIWSKGFGDVTSLGKTFLAMGLDEDVKDLGHETVFRSGTACPKNLLEPTITKPGKSLKMRKIAELHEKRAKCNKNKI